MKLKEVIDVLRKVGEQSAGQVLAAKAGPPVGYSKSRAYKIHGRSNVDRWIREGLLSISNKKISRSDLEAVAASSNRVTYLSAEQRKKRYAPK